MSRLTLDADEQQFAKVLGATIRHLRTSINMERKTMAAAANCAYSTITEIETGAATPSVTVLMRIGKVLRISVYDIIRTTEKAILRIQTARREDHA